jgi:hypothetical protein
MQDLPWLEYCLRSITKFATGFHETVVLVPEQEVNGFRYLALPAGCHLATYARDSDKAKWHLHHQVMKCHADLWCKGSDFVLHTDSDCVFSKPVAPEDYFVDGKPVMLMESYARLTNNPWQVPTQNTLKRLISHEFMRRHPQVNPIAVYPGLRERIRELHSQSFDDYVLSRKADFPWGFSEHNVIGAYAWFEHHDAYHWIDVAKDPRPADKLIQFWSHSPIDKPQSTPFGLNLTPRKVFSELGL